MEYQSGEGGTWACTHTRMDAYGEAVNGLRLPAFAGEKDLGERESQWEEHGVPAIHRPGKHDRERVRPSEEAPPFVLSEALPVVPGKLVKKIQSGDYVEMAELLKDNVVAERRRVAAGDSEANWKNLPQGSARL